MSCAVSDGGTVCDVSCRVPVREEIPRLLYIERSCAERLSLPAQLLSFGNFYLYLYICIYFNSASSMACFSVCLGSAPTWRIGIPCMGINSMVGMERMPNIVESSPSLSVSIL